MDLSGDDTLEKLTHEQTADGGDGAKKKKKRRKRKTVHKVITKKMAQAEEQRKEVDGKIYAELSIPLPTEYGGPQIDLR